MAGSDRDRRFRETVEQKAERRRRARARDDGLWFGLGMFGLVGWSVAIPTVAGVALGLWLDRRFPAQPVSWTLTFLLVGVAVGALVAWHWVRRESGHG
jgi:ATP synthase protein I